MTENPNRSTGPRRWTALTLAGTAAGLAVTTMQVQAAAPALNPTPTAQVWLAQAEGGEGGEGGEAGAHVSEDEAIAYLELLASVGAHARAAADMYAAGDSAGAVGLIGHIEAEVMGDLSPLLEEFHGPDLDSLIAAAAEALGTENAPEQVDAAIAALLDAVHGANSGIHDDDQLAAVAAILRHAGDEYAEAIEGGDTLEAMPLFEARGFVAEARMIARKPSSQIAALLGYVNEPELIHRDNLVLV